MPLRVNFAGFIFCRKTSALPSSRSRASRPSGTHRLTEKDILLRFAEANHADVPSTNGGPKLRASSPTPGLSTLMTVAPRSARYIDAVGPA